MPQNLPFHFYNWVLCRMCMELYLRAHIIFLQYIMKFYFNKSYISIRHKIEHTIDNVISTILCIYSLCIQMTVNQLLLK